MNQAIRQTHLEFYREHKIAPVRYDLSDMTAHLERRFALYTKLGLLPVSFKKSKILEVAAGTGHNSLYVAQLLPLQYILLEPNEIAIEHIRETYKTFNKPHTSPEIINAKIEEYSPKDNFDIVLCENWLGSSENELTLLKKVSSMVVEQGMLVLTTISPIGFLPNVLRRFMASYLAPLNKTFSERTKLLTQAFGSHLETMTAMTRSKEDWVQDNMINPAYFCLCLNIPLLLKQLGDQFEVVGSSPAFSEDWRWFKELHGKARNFNQQFLNEYWKKAHNFLDYREPARMGNNMRNSELEEKALQILNAVAIHEDTQFKKADTTIAANKVLKLLNDFITLTPDDLIMAKRGLKEALNLINSVSSITVDSVAKLAEFSAVFGRETVYVSLLRIKS